MGGSPPQILVSHGLLGCTFVPDLLSKMFYISKSNSFTLHLTHSPYTFTFTFTLHPANPALLPAARLPSGGSGFLYSFFVNLPGSPMDSGPTNEKVTSVAVFCVLRGNRHFKFLRRVLFVKMRHSYGSSGRLCGVFWSGGGARFMNKKEHFGGPRRVLPVK